MSNINLHDYFYYLDGHLYWKVDRPGHTLKDTKCLSVGSHGYRQVTLMGKVYLVHRVIFFLCHGVWPIRVDHRDEDKLNNWVDNLRAALPHQNSANRGKNKTNTTGYKGVYLDKRKNKFYSRIMVRGKFTYLGYFDNKEEASKVYTEKAKELLGEFVKDG